LFGSSLKLKKLNKNYEKNKSAKLEMKKNSSLIFSSAKDLMHKVHGEKRFLIGLINNANPVVFLHINF